MAYKEKNEPEFKRLILNSLSQIFAIKPNIDLSNQDDLEFASDLITENVRKAVDKHAIETNEEIWKDRLDIKI